MDWPLAIDKNRERLLRIVIALMASLGLVKGGMLTTLPRFIYRKALLIIRPAEAAVRRLIMMAAYEMELSRVKLRARRTNDAGHNDFSFAASLQQRLPSFNMIDPLKTFDYETPDFSSFAQTLGSNTSNFTRIPAGQLGRRLLALKSALDNIQAQATRLTRWYADRDLALKNCRPHRFSPMRPGLPPGYHRKPIHEIEDILLDCHSLAGVALDRRDSS